MRTRRLLALAALVPQLVVLGLGRSVVLCIADGGHARIEVAASSCCSVEAPAAVDADGEPDDHGAHDCDGCTDLSIVVVTPCSRTADGSPPVQVAPAETLTALSGPAVLVGGRALTPERCSRGSPQPPHLLALRTVRLRC